MQRIYPLFRALWFRVALGVLLAYALFGFAGVPFLIRHYAPPAVSQAIQRPLNLGKVSFNPFLFRLEVRDTALTESDGQPVFALQRLLVDFELARSILNRAPTFAELRLEGPAVNLVQDREGVLNMAKIAASLPPDDPAKAKPPEDAPLPSLIVQRILLAEGQVAFENQAVQPAVVNRAEHLGLELKNISTLPERHGLYEIEAALPGGGTLRWQGDVSLNPIKSSGKLDIEALQLATVLHLAGDRLALADPGGDIGLSTRYQFSRTQTDTLLNVDDAVFKLTGLKLATAGEPAPLIDLEEFRIGNVSLDLAPRKVGIPAIVLRKGKVFLSQDSAGRLNWQTVFKPAPASPNAPAPANPASAEPPGPPWQVNLGEFSIAEMGFEYSDPRPGKAVKAGVGDFGLSLKADATAGGTKAPVVHVGDLGLHLKQITLNQDQTALLALDEVSLGEASLALPDQTVSVPRFNIGKGRISAAFNEAGQMNWLSLAPSGPAPGQLNASNPSPAATPPATDTPPAPPWKVNLGQFGIAGIALDYADARAKPPIQAAIGDFGLSLKAEATAGGSDEPVVHVGDFAVHLKQISLNQAKNALLTLQDISLEQASLDLPDQKVRVPLIAVSKGRVSAAMDAAGRIDWQALAPPASPAPAEKPPAKPPESAPVDAAPARPWQVAVDQFKLSELALEYADASHQAPIKTTLGNFGLSLKAAAVAGIGPLKASIQDMAVQMDRLAVNDTQSASSLLKWDSFRLEDGRVDLEKQEASIRRLALKGGATGIARESSGAIYPASLFTAEDKAEVARDAESVKKTLTQAKPAADPWRFSLGELTIDDFGIGVKDRGLAGGLAYDLDGLTVSVKSVANTGKTPVRFDVRTKIRQGGALSLVGTAAPTGESAKASIKLDRFNLTQLQPLIAEFAYLNMDSANLSTDLALGFRQAKPRPEVRVTGAANLANLKLTQSKDGNKFLSWGDLTTKGIDFSLAPDKLAIKEVKVIAPDAVIAIHKDKSTNISDLIKSQKPAPKPAPAKTGKSPSGSAPVFPVSISRILVEKGKVDFSDVSLILPFATRVHDFGGSISGFAMTPNSRTTLQLSGRVDDYGETKVDGSLSPMDIKQFSDINVIFRNVTMSSLSPYSATFAGRKIESGKLNLDLLYKIENSELKSQNKIMLEQFKLGEVVESPNATSLPLDLAISLLTDSEGKIQASVPVEGRLDNPQFALGGVIWDAFVTLITNVAAAPFNALASMVGTGDGGDPGTVAFDPGSATLPPPEREKLQKLVAGLSTRPKLKLTVHGGYDPQADAVALKSLAIRRAVADQLDVTLAPGELPDAVNITDAASQRALDKLAKATGAADTVVTAYQREKGRQPQRAGLFGKPSETPEFYEMLLAALVEQAPLPPSDLDALAAQRGKAVLAELVEKQKLAPARVAEGPPEAAKAMAEQRVAIRLELNTE